MILLVWQYRLGMVKRDRRQWMTEESRTPQEREPPTDASLVNLARQLAVPVRQEEPVQATAKFTRRID